jgi:hypothetical protein
MGAAASQGRDNPGPWPSSFVPYVERAAGLPRALDAKQVNRRRIPAGHGFGAIAPEEPLDFPFPEKARNVGNELRSLAGPTAKSAVAWQSRFFYALAVRARNRGQRITRVREKPLLRLDQTECPANTHVSHSGNHNLPVRPAPAHEHAGPVM